LEASFRELAHEDGDVFLPNPSPSTPVDFVFVAMEPSLGRWAHTRAEARAKIDAGFRNFAFHLEDFILHFCIRTYLCTHGQTYHLTDLAKGAMLVRDADLTRRERWDRWYPLLRKELTLVAKPGARVCAVGSQVESYLQSKRLNYPMTSILHYSSQAAVYRERAVHGRETEFEGFASTLTLNQILQVAELVMAEAGFTANLLDHTLSRLRAARLTDSRKKLAFTYKIEFQNWNS
jgi:hypothetical protein